MDNKEAQEVLRKMKSLKKWLSARMVEIDQFWKIKKDHDYYIHMCARLEKRVERLERELKLDEEDDK